MNYKQLSDKNKVEIDILLKQSLSMKKDCSYNWYPPFDYL